MTFRVKYLLDQTEEAPHYKFLHALNENTAQEMLNAHLEESGYHPEILGVDHYDAETQSWESQENFKTHF